MSELLVVGSTAYDTIITPTERREYIIGGSAAFGAYAASFFTKSRLCGAVGNDWGPERTQIFTDRGIVTDDLKIHADEKTFFWEGEYFLETNSRRTLQTQLNVLTKFSPDLCPASRKSPFVFLANISPVLQMQTLRQCENVKLAVADTMNFYITNERAALVELMTMIDGLVLNDEEAEMMTEKKDIFSAGDRLLEMGPKFVIIKKGSHGCVFLSKDETFSLPAFPTRGVLEPTGAGDCFAGAMMGYLASQDATDYRSIKKAVAYGTVTASYVVEDFSFDALRRIGRKEIDARLEKYQEMLEI